MRRGEWTEADGRSNSSAEYGRAVEHVEGILARSGLAEAEVVARLVVSGLAYGPQAFVPSARAKVDVQTFVDAYDEHIRKIANEEIAKALQVFERTLLAIVRA